MGVESVFGDTKEGSERFMKKLCLILIAVCLLVTTGLTGCGGKGGEQGKPAGDIPALVSEDLKPGNDTVFATEKGYYYYSYAENGFRYTDRATGKDMYLCNKPECRHDGNEFCVATNDKYNIERVGMYSGQIFATAIEVTDTQYRYHLLSLALDGSVLNEHVTYLTLEKMGVIPATHIDGGQLYIHRNVAMIPLWLVGDDGTETTQYFGTAIINLETREVTYLDEEPFSTENEKVTDITAHGDYFYYCRKEGKKTVLHRYNIKDGTDETHKLLVGFNGMYVVQDENTIVYTRSDNSVLCVYHRETGESEEKVKLKKPETVYYMDGTSEEKETVYKAFELKTDGEYIYVTKQSSQRIKHDESFNVLETWEEAYVHVFDRELKSVAILDMAEVMAFAKEVRTENPEEFYPYYNRMLYFTEDTVYCVLPNVNTYKEDYVYRCTREEFLTGTPQFMYTFTMA